jgi:hypothetical protein
MDLMDSDLGILCGAKQAAPAGVHVDDQIPPGTALRFGGAQRPYSDHLVRTVSLSQPATADLHGVHVVEAQIGRNPGGEFGLRGDALA